MECNRDEALRAKEIAEKKFSDKDIMGAKKFAAKAQSLYPDLEGIQQMIATFDVYISAEKSKVNGESDMYAILGTKPLSDEETVRKQYRKLALMLHPDKNKSIGAEGAFKFISEAWSLLSDKTKKLAYDKKRSENGSYNLAQDLAQNSRAQKGQKSNKTKTSAPKSSTPSYEPNPSTFWTVCHQCKMQYEYLRKYLNQNLLCPNCRNPFLAIETGPPYANGSSNKASNQANINFQWGPFSGTGGASSSAQAATMVQQAYEKVKRERVAAEAAKKKEEALRRKRARKVSGVSSSVAVKRRRGIDDLGVKQGPSKPRSIWELSHAEIQTILMKKAKIEMQKKLSEVAVMQNNPMANGDPVKIENDKVLLEPISIDVIDSDFHDFDKDRMETCFEANQVWAAYSFEDGMPQKYAMIHQVISLNPFKLRVSWLNSSTKSEVGLFSWVGSFLLATTGEFKIGKQEDIDVLNCFSHMVKWTKGAVGAVCIYPRKGDVWALYRNWSPEWNELTENEVIHKYDIVEVLEDFDEEVGVIVIPLIKVAGFKSVFHRHMDPTEAKMIPRTEMLRFSHQVPSQLLNGLKGPKAPICCRELDPAATPLELLHVMINVVEEKILENDENIEVEKMADGTKKSKNIEMEDKSNLHNNEIVKIEEKFSKSYEEKLMNGRKYEEVEILEDRRESQNIELVNSVDEKSKKTLA